MTFEEFSKKFRCSVSSEYDYGCRVRYHNRPILRRTWLIYIDIRTFLPFDPKTNDDCLNCISFSSIDSSENAKRQAYDFIKNKGSLERIEDIENEKMEIKQNEQRYQLGNHHFRAR
ncbi:MAG: hypothetical protein M9949_05995 [Candidatus Kapabacteria bacterium]|nr:hypothetical protein [Candidatus Kapabacteria bacterium]